MLLKKSGNDVTIMKRCLRVIRNMLLEQIGVSKNKVNVNKEKYKTTT